MYIFEQFAQGKTLPHWRSIYATGANNYFAKFLRVIGTNRGMAECNIPHNQLSVGIQRLIICFSPPQTASQPAEKLI